MRGQASAKPSLSTGIPFQPSRLLPVLPGGLPLLLRQGIVSDCDHNVGASITVTATSMTCWTVEPVTVKNSRSTPAFSPGTRTHRTGLADFPHPPPWRPGRPSPRPPPERASSFEDFEGEVPPPTALERHVDPQGRQVLKVLGQMKGPGVHDVQAQVPGEPGDGGLGLLVISTEKQVGPLFAEGRGCSTTPGANR